MPISWLDVAAVAPVFTWCLLVTVCIWRGLLPDAATEAREIETRAGVIADCRMARGEVAA